MEKPKIIKKNSSKKPQESGCCFRSCGGTPLIQNYKQAKNSFWKLLKRIDKM